MDQENNKNNNVLIVDDTPENLTVLRQILTEHGYRVRPALNGEIALRTIKTDLPDLILLDIRMPGIEGYEVCSRLKADTKTKDIPVIFISALNELNDKVKAFSLGGVDYITKPFQVEEVLARVSTHITLHNLQQRLEEKNENLAKALEKVKQLSGLLPICCGCKKIRDDEGYWEQIESYISHHSEAEFSHGICPKCLVKLYPKLVDDDGKIK